VEIILECSIICFFLGPFGSGFLTNNSPLGASLTIMFFFLFHPFCFWSKDWHHELPPKVKPENILVSCERAILCDFGVAETVADAGLKRARHLLVTEQNKRVLKKASEMRI